MIERHVLVNCEYETRGSMYTSYDLDEARAQKERAKEPTITITIREVGVLFSFKVPASIAISWSNKIRDSAERVMRESGYA